MSLSNGQEAVLIALAGLVIRDQDSLLKAFQADHCGCNGGEPKFVFRSPAAYQIGQLIKENESWLIPLTNPKN